MKATIAKSPVLKGDDVRVFVDGNQTNYSLAASAKFWILTFSYCHSTHRVVVSMSSVSQDQSKDLSPIPSQSPVSSLSPLSSQRPSPSGEMDEFSRYVYAVLIILGIVAVTATAVGLATKKRKKN